MRLVWSALDVERELDGEIDYSRYSLSELRQAESHISRDRYPKNYSNLKLEIKHRVGDGGQGEPDAIPESEEGVWERLEHPSNRPEVLSNKALKYIATFVAVATVLNIATTLILEANGYLWPD